MTGGASAVHHRRNAALSDFKCDVNRNRSLPVSPSTEGEHDSFVAVSTNPLSNAASPAGDTRSECVVIAEDERDGENNKYRTSSSSASSSKMLASSTTSSLMSAYSVSSNGGTGGTSRGGESITAQYQQNQQKQSLQHQNCPHQGHDLLDLQLDDACEASSYFSNSFHSSDESSVQRGASDLSTDDCCAAAAAVVAVGSNLKVSTCQSEYSSGIHRLSEEVAAVIFANKESLGRSHRAGTTLEKQLSLTVDIDPHLTPSQIIQQQPLVRVRPPTDLNALNITATPASPHAKNTVEKEATGSRKGKSEVDGKDGNAWLEQSKVEDSFPARYHQRLSDAIAYELPPASSDQMGASSAGHSSSPLFEIGVARREYCGCPSSSDGLAIGQLSSGLLGSTSLNPESWATRAEGTSKTSAASQPIGDKNPLSSPFGLALICPQGSVSKSTSTPGRTPMQQQQQQQQQLGANTLHAARTAPQPPNAIDASNRLRNFIDAKEKASTSSMSSLQQSTSPSITSVSLSSHYPSNPSQSRPQHTMTRPTPLISPTTAVSIPLSKSNHVSYKGKLLAHGMESPTVNLSSSDGGKYNSMNNMNNPSSTSNQFPSSLYPGGQSNQLAWTKKSPTCGSPFRFFSCRVAKPPSPVVAFSHSNLFHIFPREAAVLGNHTFHRLNSLLREELTPIWRKAKRQGGAEPYCLGSCEGTGKLPTPPPPLPPRYTSTDCRARQSPTSSFTHSVTQSSSLSSLSSEEEPTIEDVIKDSQRHGLQVFGCLSIRSNLIASPLAISSHLVDSTDGRKGHLRDFERVRRPSNINERGSFPDGGCHLRDICCYRRPGCFKLTNGNTANSTMTSPTNKGGMVQGMFNNGQVNRPPSRYQGQSNSAKTLQKSPESTPLMPPIAAFDVPRARPCNVHELEEQSSWHSKQPRHRHSAPLLQLWSGGCMRPKPTADFSGGDDCYFYDNAIGTFGVADGVGQWSRLGYPVGLFSLELLLRCRRALSTIAFEAASDLSEEEYGKGASLLREQPTDLLLRDRILKKAPAQTTSQIEESDRVVTPSLSLLCTARLSSLVSGIDHSRDSATPMLKKDVTSVGPAGKCEMKSTCGRADVVVRTTAAEPLAVLAVLSPPNEKSEADVKTNLDYDSRHQRGGKDFRGSKDTAGSGSCDVVTETRQQQQEDRQRQQQPSGTSKVVPQPSLRSNSTSEAFVSSDATSTSWDQSTNTNDCSSTIGVRSSINHDSRTSSNVSEDSEHQFLSIQSAEGAHDTHSSSCLFSGGWYTDSDTLNNRPASSSNGNDSKICNIANSSSRIDDERQESSPGLLSLSLPFSLPRGGGSAKLLTRGVSSPRPRQGSIGALNLFRSVFQTKKQTRDGRTASGSSTFSSESLAPSPVAATTTTDKLSAVNVIEGSSEADDESCSRSLPLDSVNKLLRDQSLSPRDVTIATESNYSIDDVKKQQPVENNEPAASCWRKDTIPSCQHSVVSVIVRDDGGDDQKAARGQMGGAHYCGAATDEKSGRMKRDSRMIARRSLKNLEQVAADRQSLVVTAIRRAMDETNLSGGSTLLCAIITPLQPAASATSRCSSAGAARERKQILCIASVGDSGLVVLRRLGESPSNPEYNSQHIDISVDTPILTEGHLDGGPKKFEVVFRTPQIRTQFNCPHQYTKLPTRKEIARLRTLGLLDLSDLLKRLVVVNGDTQQDGRSPKTKTPSPLSRVTDSANSNNLTVYSASSSDGNGDEADSQGPPIFYYEVELREGDLIVAGTDGLFDNIDEEEIASLLGSCISPKESQVSLSSCSMATPPKCIAEVVLEEAFRRSLRRDVRSPFQRMAEAEGLRFQGGKLDDISVVASWVVWKTLD